jgi:hypothetical protein
MAMPTVGVQNLWGRQGLLTLSETGQLYTHHLDGIGPALEPLRGSFQALIIPTALKQLCSGLATIPAPICARANHLLATLNLPWKVDCAAPNRDGWLTVEIDHDGCGLLIW